MLKIVIIIRVPCVRMMIYIGWIVVCFMIFFFVIMYIFVLYMLFCRGPQGRLVRQLSHPLKIKSLLTYLLTEKRILCLLHIPTYLILDAAYALTGITLLVLQLQRSPGGHVVQIT